MPEKEVNRPFNISVPFLIFTTANDSPNLAHRLLMAYSDLEKRKQKFQEKHFTGVCANLTLGKNPMEPPQDGHLYNNAF